jgi:hypothetical protein
MMMKPTRSAEELREELNRTALKFSLDSEGSKIEFFLPTLADPSEGPADHNWDVQATCPEGLDELARRAVEHVAARYDLTEG